ncbi:conserved hypothetical protein [Nostocoides japonicum T1-X7]|uniref:Uncharacterized protein n=1 Tax=Nostocoides japonicum T1-X7 TaxID=1194083 RepID=A0A077LW48_9MICO|nr:formate dehydrogenase subunit delta [Tetrasphaera japonica]CCH77052.1 conserved hypothetical protein [Tetrasphaera japonica T1-X7]
MTACVDDREHEPAVIRMGNDIARHLEYLPPETAADQIAAHIERFWEPRMSEELLVHADRNDTTMHPLLLAAARRLRPPPA